MKVYISCYDFKKIGVLCHRLQTLAAVEGVCAFVPPKTEDDEQRAASLRQLRNCGFCLIFAGRRNAKHALSVKNVEELEICQKHRIAWTIIYNPKYRKEPWWEINFYHFVGELEFWTIRGLQWLAAGMVALRNPRKVRSR